MQLLFATSTAVLPLRSYTAHLIQGLTPFIRGRFHTKPWAHNARIVRTVKSCAVQRGTLYVVATPIGNLDDFSSRARTVLSSVDLIAAEDTRVTGLLLQRLGIRTQTGARLLSCHAHNSASRIQPVLSALNTGSVALVTDAGTPCISDPGQVIIRAATSSGYTISPIPGSCAVAAALSVSGLGAGDGHIFLGFLPRSGSARTKRLSEAVSNSFPTVMYEAPHRVLDTLRDLCALAPKRGVCVARELTKRYETVYHLPSLEDAVAHFENENAQSEVRGEFVIVLDSAPAVKKAMGDNVGRVEIELGKVASALLEAGVGVKMASRILAESSNVSRKEIYQHLLKLKANLDDNLVGIDTATTNSAINLSKTKEKSMHSTSE